ncbi:MAG TPA: hypothetical protein ENK16_00405 [Chromatiales bacterium]|nr:hypothetical protein [Chromatiales bacterium]
MHYKKFGQTLLFASACLIVASAQARHLKLYTYDIADVGSTVVTYTYDWITGPKSGVAEGNPQLHEIEIEYAINKHWMQSFYIDYDYAPSTANFEGVNQVSALKTEFNFPFSEKGKHFFDFRMNIELAKAVNGRKSAYGETDVPDTAEFRFILEKNFEHFTLILGPMFVQNIGGPSSLGTPNFGFANALLFDISDKVGAGLELHSFMGEWDQLDNIDKQAHVLVPNLDVALTDTIGFSIGGGIGLTSSSDDFTLRASINYTFVPRSRRFPSRH